MINNIINWIIENKEWFFSGIGVTVLLGIITFFRKIFCKKSEVEKNIKIIQTTKGKNNTQIGIQNNYYGDNKNDK
jgi:hypothetical protein